VSPQSWMAQSPHVCTHIALQLPLFPSVRTEEWLVHSLGTVPARGQERS
jgi:hypothetical protein